MQAVLPPDPAAAVRAQRGVQAGPHRHPAGVRARRGVQAGPPLDPHPAAVGAVFFSSQPTSCCTGRTSSPTSVFTTQLDDFMSDRLFTDTGFEEITSATSLNMLQPCNFTKANVSIRVGEIF